jgi:L-ribulose-5-phosphate 3-epimerase
MEDHMLENTVWRCSRRNFLYAAGGAAAASMLGSPAALAQASHSKPANQGRIFKSVKWGMIGEGETILDKFQLCRELGYDGMELISPGNLDPQEVRDATQKSGMPVHGLVDMKHWQVRLSDPEQATRETARGDLTKALEDAKAFGGDTVLLVPGKVSGEQETHDDVWKRSIEQIRLTLPTASKLGVRILIENVWNGFCETPELMRDYLDEIGSPWVGAYFDIGNVRKFGPSEDWIRTLGPRIVKLDVKDWGKSNGFCKIGDGDVNWKAVRDALAEIEFTGWCTAEVEGGKREQLADIAARMDRVLAL